MTRSACPAQYQKLRLLILSPQCINKSRLHPLQKFDFQMPFIRQEQMFVRLNTTALNFPDHGMNIWSNSYSDSEIIWILDSFQRPLIISSCLIFKNRKIIHDISCRIKNIYIIMPMIRLVKYASFKFSIPRNKIRIFF